MNQKPAITSPVSRCLGTADRSRSISFYRDVLGFEVSGEGGATEATYGPALIRFGNESYPPNDWETPRPPGSAMLFFETDDVVAMRDAIRARDGNASQIEKVNWIKMRMFAIRDPDGHTLWFGQSYDQPVPAAPPPKTEMMIEKTLPEMPVNDVAAAADYYRDRLGFRTNYQQDDLCVLDRDQITILLIARTERHTGIGSFGAYVKNADTLYDELRTKGALVQDKPVSHPWGLRTFDVLDPEGNRIRFAQPFE